MRCNDSPLNWTVRVWGSIRRVTFKWNIDFANLTILLIRVRDIKSRRKPLNVRQSELILIKWRQLSLPHIYGGQQSMSCRRRRNRAQVTACWRTSRKVFAEISCTTKFAFLCPHSHQRHVHHLTLCQRSALITDCISYANTLIAISKANHSLQVI